MRQSSLHEFFNRRPPRYRRHTTEFDIPRCGFSLHFTVLYISPDLSCIPDLTGQIYYENRHSIFNGEYAEVWRCRSNLVSPRGSAVINLDNRQVAVKVHRMSYGSIHKRLRREIKAWARLQHEHILPLLGLVCDFPGSSVPSLVSPWMDNRSLVYYLNHRSSALTRYERFRLVSILRSDYPM